MRRDFVEEERKRKRIKDAVVVRVSLFVYFSPNAERKDTLISSLTKILSQ